MNVLRRITAVSLTLAVLFGVSAGTLHAQFTPKKGGPVATPRLQFPVVEPKPAETKLVGKWFLKNEVNDIVVELGADGLGKFDFKLGDKAYSMNAKLKHGELRVNYGNNLFMIYDTTLRDGKLVLTGGNLKENQEYQMAKLDVIPAPKPKLVEPAPAPPKVARKVIVEKGLHDAPRGPTPEPVPPADGAAPTEAFLIKLIQHRMEGNSGGITYLMEIHSHKVGPARAAAPTETQPYATNSKVIPVSVKWTYKAYGQGSTATAEKESRYICWITDTGEWRAGSIEEKTGPITSVDK